MSRRYAGNLFNAETTLFSLPEELFDRVHDRVLALDLARDDAFVLVEVLGQVLDELTRAVRRLDLAVREQIHERQDFFLQQLDAGMGVVDRPVITVGEMERIDVPQIRGVLVRDHLRAQLVRRADHRAARLAGPEERIAIDLFGHRVVDDEAALDAVILRAQPRIDPEALDANDCLLLVAHGAGDVHHVDDHRVRLRQRHAAPRAIALVLFDRDDDGVLRVVRPHRDLATHRLAIGAPEVTQRLRADRANAGVLVFVRDDLLGALGLDPRELELLAHDLGELLHAELDVEQVIARAIASLVTRARLFFALAERVAGLARTLADAALLLVAVLEPRDVDRRNRDRKRVLALLRDHLV